MTKSRLFSAAGARLAGRSAVTKSHTFVRIKALESPLGEVFNAVKRAQSNVYFSR